MMFLTPLLDFLEAIGTSLSLQTLNVTTPDSCSDRVDVSSLGVSFASVEADMAAFDGSDGFSTALTAPVTTLN